MIYVTINGGESIEKRDFYENRKNMGFTVIITVRCCYRQFFGDADEGYFMIVMA